MSLPEICGLPSANWQYMPKQYIPNQNIVACQIPTCSNPQCCKIKKSPCKTIACKCSLCTQENKCNKCVFKKVEFTKACDICQPTCNPCQPTCNPCQPFCNPCQPVCNPCQPTCNPCQPIYNNPCQPICNNNPCQPVCDTRVALITTSAGPQVIQNDPQPFPYARVINWNQIPDNSVGGIAYNAVTGEFTVPKTGYYSLSSYITWEPNDIGNREMWINQIPSGSNTVRTLAADSRKSTIGIPTRVTLSTEAFLNAGDRVFVSVWQNSGVPLQIFFLSPQGNKFSIILLD